MPTTTTTTMKTTSTIAAAGIEQHHHLQSTPQLHHPIVQTTYGPIRGEKRISYLGDTFYSFRSVPYARPPLGELRFRDPQPPLPWTETLDATRECPNAPFVDATETATFVTSEDCLLLNVYTRRLPPGAAQPVMVWLHGGAFKVGSSSEHMYGPDFLLAQNVVVVTVNYRLGALGFLSIADPDVRVPGNAGLKDQTLALRWVRNNIAVFGGDAQNVTLFGNSAGACSVHLHMLSPLSAGLFDRAIVQSGNALSEWSNYPKNRWTERLAEALGWQPPAEAERRDAELYTFLCGVSAADIVARQDEILTREEASGGGASFGPANEAYRSEQCFFIDDPEVLAAAEPWSARIPLMTGALADEGLLVYRSMSKHPDFFQSLAGFECLVPVSFGYARGSEQSVRVAKQIREQYYGDEEPTTENYLRTIQIWGDLFFWYGVHRALAARIDSTAPVKAATYLYRYACDSGRFNWKKLQFLGADIPGASHADEVHYLFKCAYLTERLPENSREMQTVKKMVGMWTQFATTGNPNCSEMENIVWKPIEAANQEGVPFKCLNIEPSLSFIDLPETDRIAFWNRLYAENKTSK